jgi:transcriptional antiterminator RfaH
MLRWYVVHTKPSCESVADVNLRRQGYDVYFPRAISSGRRRGRLHEHVVALFPRYLFLKLDEGHQPLAPIRSTTGVAGIVRFGLSYAIVPDAVISDLRAREDGATGLHRVGRAFEFVPGMPVQVQAGPFDGLEGIFEREAGTDRVVVLLKLLGQSASVYIPMDSLVPSYAAA